MKYRFIEIGETVEPIFDPTSGVSTPDMAINLTITNQTSEQRETIELCNSTYVLKELLYKYGSFKLLTPESDNRSDIAVLEYIWKQFLTTCGKLNYAKLFESFSYRYNPIENYDKYSEIRVSFNGSETNTTTMEGIEHNNIEYTGTDTNTVKYEGTTTSTFSTPENGYTDVTTGSNSPENTNTFYGTNKTVNEIAHREESTETGYNDRTDTNEHSYEDRIDKGTKEFEDRIDTHTTSFNDRENVTTDRTHGNIGISTPMDMAMKELTARKFDLQKYIVQQFIMEFAIL